MTDNFQLVSIERLYQILTNENSSDKGFLGIPKNIFINHSIPTSYHTNLFQQNLEFPLGVAAGPHSQLAQNIISSWLCGARYIELKTIQTLDELSVDKPCIDMQDEGYNCEWSQELKIKDTFNQYLDAWILLHILNHQRGSNLLAGTIFNISIGYDFGGIMNTNVQWFLNKMQNCSNEKQEKIELLKPYYPAVSDLEIPDSISNNITLSTMHGCPPDEIEKIATYLIEKKKLHTYVKLNPTLLGPDELRKILNTNGRFKTHIPEEAFEHDLKYPEALKIIESLTKKADHTGVQFGLKLTNTLESENHKKVFDKTPTMYMSGRALHPISVNLARKLQNDFQGNLSVSFAGGADAYNFSQLISCGLNPVTVSTDILKPGGYGRLHQYYSELEKAFSQTGAKSIADYIQKKSGSSDLKRAKLINLNRYADEVLRDKKYKKNQLKEPNIKGTRKLGFFDCISAPCRENCATNQDIPEYLYYTSKGDFNRAFGTILKTNPQPGITGNICDHLCQLRCTRINYDQSLKIREIKRFLEENHSFEQVKKNSIDTPIKVAIIGAGPSGLSCAYYLSKEGVQVEIFEKTDYPGGMVNAAVPIFRLENEKIQRDVDRVMQMGVQFHYKTRVDSSLFQKLYSIFDYLYVATGAPKTVKLDIPGADTPGVIDPLNFLFLSKKGENPIKNKKVAVIGGGNTAMDTARVAQRLVGERGSVTVLYRRTLSEMPADLGEINAVIEEGIQILEEVSLDSIHSQQGHISGMVCSKMEQVKTLKGELQKPKKIEGSEFFLPFDVIIPAVGQEVSVDFIDKELFLPNPKTFEIKVKRVFTGGDALHGAATAIQAIGDGRKVAEKILHECEIERQQNNISSEPLLYDQLMKLRSERINSVPLLESPLSERRTFKPVSYTFTKEMAVIEAARCLQCQQLCNICVTVCPNRANYHYVIEPCEIKLYKAIRGEKEPRIEYDKLFKIEQKHQILNISDFCNECGNCSTFCPTSGAPYRDKPRFYLTIQSFNKAEEGYFLSKLKNKQILIFKEHGGIRTLEQMGEEWIYETDHVKAVFNKADFDLQNVEFKVPCAQQVHFDMAAEMRILYYAAENLY